MVDWQTQQFLSKNENVLYNVQNSERDFVIDILKEKMSDLEIELQRMNVVIEYLHSQVSLKATEYSLSSSATRNLNSISNQDSVGNNLTEASNSTIRSSKQQSNNSRIKQKILVAGDSMLNNIYKKTLKTAL